MKKTVTVIISALMAFGFILPVFAAGEAGGVLRQRDRKCGLFVHAVGYSHWSCGIRNKRPGR